MLIGVEKTLLKKAEKLWRFILLSFCSYGALNAAYGLFGFKDYIIAQILMGIFGVAIAMWMWLETVNALSEEFPWEAEDIWDFLGNEFILFVGTFTLYFAAQLNIAITIFHIEEYTMFHGVNVEIAGFGMTSIIIYGIYRKLIYTNHRLVKTAEY